MARSRHSLILMLVMTGAVAVACGGTDVSDTIDASAFCTDDDQCPAGMVCQGGFCSVPTDAGPPVDAPPGAADILVTPTSLDFGSPLLGIDSVQQIEIGNIGASDLHITDISVFESDALAEYQVSPAGAVNLVIMPGQSVMVAVTLRQQDAEIDTGEVRIASDDPDEPLSVVSLVSDLKGTPDIDTTPTSVAYGTVSYGTNNVADVDVTNVGTGNAPLVINTISITNTSGMGAVYSTELFTVTSGGTELPATLPVYLSAGDMFVTPDTLRVRVTFAATTGPGPAPSENLRILSNDVDESQVNLPISGTVIGCMTPVPETCNGLDDDCDLTADEDDPGSGGSCSTGLGGACNPGVEHCVSGGLSCVPNVTPGSVPETCNNVDDDCDGMVDDGLIQTCMTACGSGVEFCVAGGWVGCNAPPVEPESCNNVDDDCDGTIDEGDPGGGGSCATGMSGICSMGVNHCVGGLIQCIPNVTPGMFVETCNGADDDCDGVSDEGNPGGGGACASGFPGVCGPGTEQCTSGSLQCAPNVTPGAQAEICDSQDNNCDGSVDEMNPNTSCPGQNPGATGVGGWLCTAGVCQVASCASPYFNPDGSASNGCECLGDTHPNGCPSAESVNVPLGTTQTASGFVETAGASDWYVFNFTPRGVGNQYIPTLNLTVGAGDYSIQVWDSCGGAPLAGCAGTLDTWQMTFPSNPNDCLSFGNCTDATSRFTTAYVQVTRDSALACTGYTLQATNP